MSNVFFLINLISCDVESYMGRTISVAHSCIRENLYDTDKISGYRVVRAALAIENIDNFSIWLSISDGKIDLS